MTADGAGRLYVVVSHTHSRDRDYGGPEHDRVLVFEDSDGDGLLDQSRIYADGLNKALAIAFSQDGTLYAVQMKSIVRLEDVDDDGVCETLTPVLTINTKNNNNHGVFLGVAFDNENRMFTSLGNIGGEAYVIEGSDGTRISGQGDTGLIVRTEADGSELQRFAHGFWNPAELKFDAAGRLLATDNDPDARGPNRVLHIIEGGQYGYKARFGGSGLHPYCAWNGEFARDASNDCRRRRSAGGSAGLQYFCATNRFCQRLAGRRLGNQRSGARADRAPRRFANGNG